MKKLGAAIPAVAFTQFVSANYLQEIGRVITQWSMMETMLDAAIWQAGGVRNDIGRIYSAQMQVNSKLDALGAMLAQNNSLLGEQFDLVADYVRNCLSGRRNMVAHGFWADIPPQIDLHPTKAILVKFTARGRLAAAHGDGMSIDELKELSLSIAEVSSWLMDLANLLPKLRQRRGGLGHKILVPPDSQVTATRKQRALQRPTLSRKAWETRQPQPKRKVGKMGQKKARRPVQP